MEYNTHEFSAGDILTASELNEMDTQIANNTSSIDNLEKNKTNITRTESIESSVMTLQAKCIELETTVSNLLNRIIQLETNVSSL